MKHLLSPVYKELRSINPRVKFRDGRATASEADAVALMALPGFGIVEDSGVGPSPDVVEAIDPAPENGVAECVEEVGVVAPLIPSKRAGVPEWVKFMEAHGISHDEGATKAEMQEIAEAHFVRVT